MRSRRILHCAACVSTIFVRETMTIARLDNRIVVKSPLFLDTRDTYAVHFSETNWRWYILILQYYLLIRQLRRQRHFRRRRRPLWLVYKRRRDQTRLWRIVCFIYIYSGKKFNRTWPTRPDRKESFPYFVYIN